MGAEVNWSALPTIVEMLGIDDPEQLIRNVILIRDRLNEERD